MVDRCSAAVGVMAFIAWFGPALAQESAPAGPAPMVGERPYADWLAEWEKAAPEARAAMVGDFNPSTVNAAAVRAAFALLKDADPARRALGCEFAQAWLYGHVEAEEAIPAVEPLLGDPVASVRLAAAITLVTGRARPQALDVLVELARGDLVAEREGALQYLSGCGLVEPRVVELFAPLLHHADVAKRQQAVGALGIALQKNDAARPLLRAALADSDPLVRISAVRDLVYVDGADAELIEMLVVAVASDELFVRMTALNTVGALGVERIDEARPLLLTALQDAHATVRGNAIGALANLADEGGDVSEAIPRIVELVRDEDTYVRGAAAYALGHVGASTDVAVPALGALVQDPDMGTRAYALTSLKEASEEVVFALPQLITALDDRDPNTRRAVAELLALGKGRSEPAVAALARRFADPVATVRVWSCYALREIGSAAVAELPAIAKQLAEDPDPKARVEAARCIAAFGSLAGGAVDGLVAATRDPDGDVRSWSLFALGKVDVKSEPVVAALRAAAGSSDSAVAVEANKALAELGEEHDAAIAATEVAVAVKLANVGAPFFYEGQALVLSDARGVAIVDVDEEFDSADGKRQTQGIRLRWRYLAKGQSKASEGRDEASESVAEPGSLNDGSKAWIDAGPLRIGWSVRGKGSGYVYWTPESLRVELAGENEFETLDLTRFIR